VCVRQAPAAVIEEPTHLASLLQEEPLELAAPEELFSKSGTADDAEEEAAIGQGATALMLDAILMDSSVGEGGSEPASRALPLLYSSAITLSCWSIDVVWFTRQAKEEATTTTSTGSGKDKKKPKSKGKGKETALKKAFRGRIDELLKPHYKKKEVRPPPPAHRVQPCRQTNIQI
jgi:hypothetical protein